MRRPAFSVQPHRLESETLFAEFQLAGPPESGAGKHEIRDASRDHRKPDAVQMKRRRSGCYKMNRLELVKLIPEFSLIFFRPRPWNVARDTNDCAFFHFDRSFFN